jgi:predicted transcriptional regulator
MPNSAASDLPTSPVVEQLMQRIAQRGVPPPILMTPEAIRERLGQALGKRMGTKDPRRRRTLAHIMYALMASPVLSNAELGEVAGLTTQAIQRVADGLRKEGLLEVYYERNVRFQRLTHAGEDWVLPHAQGMA